MTTLTHLDPHATIDMLGQTWRDMANAQLSYWETRWRAHPNDTKTLAVRNAWRATVRSLEEYYDLPATVIARAEQRPRTK